MRGVISLGRKTGESDWISISDLMAGLMMIFLFIAISFMNNLQIKAKQVREIAVAYQEIQNSLYTDLKDEFMFDLLRWNAEIIPETLTVRFHAPEVLFTVNSFEVTSRFKQILREFFPRYLKIMRSPKYRHNIEEIRIEGHTSSEWTEKVDEEKAYFNNMKLSQDRTRSVLQYCFALIDDEQVELWARRYITANGLSSSRLVYDAGGNEYKKKSRRVEFRTKTAAEKKVVQILEEMKK
jgi:outer membrane protein OmpA-like peptidoglycan-associated protein